VHIVIILVFIVLRHNPYRPPPLARVRRPAFLELLSRVSRHESHTSPELREPEQLSRFLKARGLNVEAAFVMWEVRGAPRPCPPNISPVLPLPVPTTPTRPPT
jgi:hypothetical protein